MSSEHPVLRGSAQNPDVFFQAREACSPFYAAVPDAVQDAMDTLGARTGRPYRLFEYAGHPEAERVLVIMGSGAGAAGEAVAALAGRGERVGLVTVRLYRPFAAEAFVAALPSTTRAITVLDRTKEPGAPGEPLYQDVVTALAEVVGTGSARFEGGLPRVLGGRYGLASKEFTPAMATAALEDLASDTPTAHFTVGIVDDVSGSSLPVDPTLRHRARSARCGPSSTASAPTARSARTRTRSRSSASTPSCTRRAISSTTRRRRVR